MLTTGVSQAANSADVMTLGATATTGTTTTAASTTVSITGISDAAPLAATATVVLISAPVTSTSALILPTFSVTTAQGTANAAANAAAVASGTLLAPGPVLTVTPQAAGRFTGTGTLTVTPDVAGVYVYRITPGGSVFTTTAQTWTVTVATKVIAAATAASVGNTTGSTLVYGYAYGYYDGTINRNAAGEPWGTGEAAFTSVTTAALNTAGGVACYADLGKGAGCLLGKIVLSNGATAPADQMVAGKGPNLTYVVSGPGSVQLYNTLTTQYSAPSRVAYETTGVNIGDPGSLDKMFVINTDGTP
jgi:hypothetical protein